MNMEVLGTVATYVTAATGYAVSSYMLKVRKKPDVTFDPFRFGSTVAVGVVAGLIMAFQGDDINEESFLVASGVAMVIVDEAVNFVQDTRRDDAESTAPPSDSETADPTDDTEPAGTPNDSGPTDPANDSETKYR